MSLISGFQKAVEDCNLIDFGSKGYAFTWEKSRGMPKFVEERLDRVLATSTWMEIHRNAEVLNFELIT